MDSGTAMTIGFFIGLLVGGITAFMACHSGTDSAEMAKDSEAKRIDDDC